MAQDTTRDGRAIEVTDDHAASEFVARVDGDQVGKIVYRVEGDLVVMIHTEVDPALQGQGIAQVLARVALDDVAATGRRVVPQCPFVARYIARNPGYAELVD